MVSRHLSVGKIFISYFLQRRRSWPSCPQQAYCIDRRRRSDRIGRLFSGVRVFLRHPAPKARSCGSASVQPFPPVSGMPAQPRRLRTALPGTGTPTNAPSSATLHRSTV